MRIGSLCSGYGGLDLAVEAHYGATPAWFCEFDKAPSKILAHHWPNVPNYGDVWHTDWTQVEPVDILTAGYPCQPFSHAGKRKGADDPRHLWPGIARAISILRPSVVVLENVRGHVSLGLADVLGDLSGLGYDARWGVVRAADAGAPHGRARIFICAEPADAHGARPQGRESAWRRDVPSRRTPADTAHDGLARGRRARAGRDGSPHDDRTATDPGSQRHGGGVHAGDAGRVDGPDAGEARQRERPREVTVDRGATAPADAAGDGRDQGRAESAGIVGGPDAPECGDETRWGAYEPAIRRWESVIGRPAPRPTEPGRTGERLSPVFVEWLMGLDAGHVTDPVIGLTRTHQLKALGNGVVPQQAALALTILGGM
jgi:DNA (cytosine-5)-methyltransferase 1